MSENENEKPKRRLHFPKKLLLKTLPILMFTAGAVGGTLYVVKTNPQVLGIAATDEKAAAEKEVKNLVAEVGKLMTLPTEENPTVATVTDVEKVKSQSFFKNAQNGDKVLIFSQAKKAILYRPGDKKIIEVGIVNINQPTTQQGVKTDSVTATNSAEVSAKSWKVVVYNGTSTAGLTRPVEEELKAQVSNVTILERVVASKTDYDTTLVVDLTGDREEDATRLADVLGAVKSELPDGEKRPAGADFLVIVASDRIPAE